MRKYTIWSFLSFLLLVILSCSSDENGEETCRLTSVMAKTLFYEGVPAAVLANPNFSGKIKFEYNSNGQIIKMIGGPVNVNPGSGNGDFMFTDNMINAVSYQGSIIKAENRNGMGAYANFNIIEYTVEQGRLIAKKVKDDDYEINYQYEYVHNQIIEKVGDDLYRTFYFDNNNLVKVEQILYDYQTSETVGKIDILLSNYDTHENLLQGKYFVNGAFYKAFSKNNFRNFERKHYNYIGGEYVDSGNFSSFSFNTNVDQNGLVDLFETTCN